MTGTTELTTGINVPTTIAVRLEPKDGIIEIPPPPASGKSFISIVDRIGTLRRKPRIVAGTTNKLA